MKTTLKNLIWGKSLLSKIGGVVLVALVLYFIYQIVFGG